MQKNLFSIKSVLSMVILFLAFSINGNAQLLNVETTSNSNAFNPLSPINFSPFQVTDFNPHYAPDGVQSLLYDNGSVFNIAGPPMVSMLQDTSLGMDTYGFGAQVTANNRLADDFVLDTGADITSFDFYSYQTGAASATIDAVYLQIYDGQPGAGGSVVWGDLTTNRLLTVELMNGYRQLESTPGDTSRRIQKVTANTTGLSLDAGIYWVEFTFGGTGTSGPWAPPITITGNGTTGNALQYLGESGSFQPALDGGIATPQGVPFQIYGEEIGADECSGTPEAGTVSGPDSICPNVYFTLVATGSTTGVTGLTRQWQSSPAGADTWTDIAGATFTTYNVTGGISQATDFRFVVTCTISGDEASSPIHSVELNASEECYCIPQGTNSSRYINNFSTTGGNMNINNMGTGFSAGGYGDFYDTHLVSHVVGEDVSFAVDIMGGIAGFRIWVDWNQDGTFDTTEEVMYQSSGYASSHSGSFTVPTSAMPGETRMRIVSHWLSTTGDVDPCAVGFTYGEFEDYKFIVGELEDCDGIPEAGTVTVNPVSGNPDSTYTVSASGYSYGNGLTYQWQSNTDGAGWVDEGAATSYYSAYTATAPSGLGVEVEWRLLVTCTNSTEFSYSDTATFTTVITYCQPAFSSTSDYIVSFSLGSIENLNSGFSAGGYGDFTAMSTDLVEGIDHTVTLTSSSGSGNHGVAIWIDLNDNGTFEATERVGTMSNVGANATVEIPISIPGGFLGEHRLRVIYQFNTLGENIDPCASATWGEAEDYTVVLFPLDDCSGEPDGGVASVNPIEGTAGTTYTVSATGQTFAGGMTYQWQSNTNGAGWVNEGAATEFYSSYTAVAAGDVGDEIEWRLVTTCTASGDFAESSTAVFTIIQYCIPAGTNSSYYINNFTTTGGSANISNTGSGFSAGGYGNFYNTHEVTQVQGQGVSFTTDIVGGTAGFRIWVDWNQDGNFDTTEEVAYNSSSYSASHSGTFDVPYSALPGETRMRIVSHWLSSSGDIDPCSTTHTYGEFEDYKFNVLALEDCSGEPEGGAASVNPVEGSVGTTYTVSATGQTLASGMTYQWQSNTNGAGWVDEGAALEFYANHTAVAAGDVGDEIEWRLVTTCTASGDFAESSTAVFTIIQYCIPAGTNSNYYINDFVTTGGVINTSNIGSGFSAGGYGNFYNTHEVSQIHGQEVDFSAVFGNTGSMFGFRIWVDWNQDGVFGADEVAYQSSSYLGSHSGTFEVPTSALLGETRMRIVNHWLNSTGDVDPCSTTHTYGEFEDYKFTVLPMEDCDGTPEGGTVSVTPESGNGGSTYTVSASGYSIGYGMTYQWQSNTDDAGWVNEGDEMEYYEPYTATAPNELGVQVEWRLEVTCTNSTTTVHSDTATFTTVMTYCQPTFTYTSDYIESFSLEDIENLNSGFSPGGYGDFTSMSTHLVESSYNATLTSSSGLGNHGVSIWIDFNDNGTFEESERVGYLSSIQPNQTVQIPMDLSDALTGEHRMRVVYQYNVAGNTIDPCVSASFGEAEDYTVIIGESGPEFDCFQTTPSNGFEDGLGNLADLEFANDFTVETNQTFTVNRFRFNVILNAGQDIDAVDLRFYEDTNGSGPGDFIEEKLGLVPVSSEIIGAVGTFDVRRVTVVLSEPAILTGNTEAQSVYWIGLQVDTNAGNTYLEVTSDLNTPNQTYFYTGGAWVSSTASSGTAYDGVIEILGLCETLDGLSMDKFDFAYYPNPVRDVLNITSQKAVKSVEAFNLAGQRVISTTKVQQGQVDVNSLTPGTYVFRVTLENGQVETFKIIKK